MEDMQLYTIILRHDTSTQWAVNNPILTLGEYAVEDDTHRVKRGDGETEWNDLPYEEFGLVYLVTYSNLSGEVSDNEKLQEALNAKMSIKTFEDVNYQAVSSISIEAEGNTIGKITKISKNINTATTATNMLYIKSTDNSIQGYWSVDSNGAKVLNLIAESSITDYEVEHNYYQDQLCYYKNILYRAVEDFTSELEFNPVHWVKLASLNSEDIKYNNLKSGLEADNVKDALDELQMLDSEKLKKTKYGNKVYGTDENGAQKLYDKDELRTVDSVNGVKATDQETKNIQIDSNDINYDDDTPDEGTIKEKLDSKVDKVFAGEGAKLVRDVQFNYNSETGSIELIEDKVSPEDGSSTTETTTVDVVSEKELADNVKTLNDKINSNYNHFEEKIADEHTHFESEIQALDTKVDKRITEEVKTLNSTITEKETALTNKINTEVETLNNTITQKEQALNNRIDEEVNTLNGTITSEASRLDRRVDDAEADYNSKISALTNTVASNKADIEEKLNTAKSEINSTIEANKTELDTKIDTTAETINGRIDTEVETLNNTITEKDTAVHEKIQAEHEEINERVDNEVRALNEYINTQDNLKIDKDIADNIVVGVDVATHDKQPTIRVTSKNTQSKNAIYDYVHFKSAGDIKTTMEDADHLVVDSTVIDQKIADNVTHLNLVDGRLDAHDTEILSLKEHDVNHDNGIANNARQIANHETRIGNLETRADGFDVSLADLDSKIENEITGRKTADAELSTDISRNTLNIASNAENIRVNADNIVKVNELLRTNIEALTNSKIDKTFAEEIENKIVGNIELDTLSNNEIINLKATKISPVDNSISTSNLKIISSDNTVIAKKLEDGTIDIATNLDTDVNYFVTSEILNTTIPSDNTISLDNLTATDKTTVELQDIISDSEGTWARVKSIDTEANTCVAVTFHKHAQAVWGTVKGDINSQADLQAELAKKFTIPTEDTWSKGKKAYFGGVMPVPSIAGMAPKIDGETYCANLSVGLNAIDFKTQEATSYNIVDFRADEHSKFDIVFKKSLYNNKYPYITPRVYAEEVYFDPKTSGLTKTKLSPVIRELKGLVDTNKSSIGDINTSIEGINNTIAGLNSTVNNLTETKLDKVSDVSVVYGTDESGASTTYTVDSLRKVDTVNGKIADEAKNVTLNSEDIPYTATDTDIISRTNVRDQLDLVATDLTQIKATLKTLSYARLVWSLDDILISEEYKTNANISVGQFVSATSENNVILMGKVVKAIESVILTRYSTSYELFKYLVTNNYVNVVGIPEQATETTTVES